MFPLLVGVKVGSSAPLGPWLAPGWWGAFLGPCCFPASWRRGDHTPDEVRALGSVGSRRCLGSQLLASSLGCFSRGGAWGVAGASGTVTGQGLFLRGLYTAQ